MYVDLNTVHNPATGTVAPALWGDQIRDNFEFLIDSPACSVFNSGAQSVASSTNTILTADSEREDNDSMHSTVTNTSRITVQTAGRYLFIANVQFQDNTGTRVVTDFLQNGATIVGGDVSVAVGGGTDDRKSICRLWRMAATDYMEVRVNQNSGVNRNVTLHEFSAVFITR